MPKALKLRRHKALPLSSTPYNTSNVNDNIEVQDNITANTPIETSSKSGNAFSRGQRKRMEKKKRMLRKKEIVDGIRAKQNVVGQSGLFLLSSLESSLPSNTQGEPVRPSAAAPLSNKMKGKVAVREVERMRLVQQHPSFQKDPLAAIKYHIEHMMTVKNSQKS